MGGARGPRPPPPIVIGKKARGTQTFLLILVYMFSLQASEPQPYLPWMYGIMYFIQSFR